MKYITCCLLCVSICLCTAAQSHKITMGVQGGVNLNSIYGNDLLEENTSTGFSISGMVKVPFSKHIGMKIMPAYDVYGWAYKNLVFETDLFAGTKSSITYKLNYINLPVLAEYTFGKKVKWNVNAGVFAGVLANNKMITRTTDTVGGLRRVVYKSKSNEVRKFNAGFVVGAGVQFPLTSKINLNIDVRNSTGLTNIYKNTSTYNNSIKTITYTALAGVSYNL